MIDRSTEHREESALPDECQTDQASSGDATCFGANQWIFLRSHSLLEVLD